MSERKRKIIQVATLVDGDWTDAGGGLSPTIVALCDDGSLWEQNFVRGEVGKKWETVWRRVKTNEVEEGD
jgi:hypothetical protein